MMKNTIFLLPLCIILSLLISCQSDPVGPSSPDGYFISATIDGNQVEYIDGDGDFETTISRGGDLGTDTCWLAYGNGITEFDFGLSTFVEGLTIGLQSEYIGPCPDEEFEFPNLFQLGSREVRDDSRAPRAYVSYLDPMGVCWESPREPSANNVFELTKRTFFDDDPFFTLRMDVEGTFSSWVYNFDGDSLRIEDGKFRLFFVPSF